MLVLLDHSVISNTDGCVIFLPNNWNLGSGFLLAGMCREMASILAMVTCACWSTGFYSSAAIPLQAWLRQSGNLNWSSLILQAALTLSSPCHPKSGYWAKSLQLVMDSMRANQLKLTVGWQFGKEVFSSKSRLTARRCSAQPLFDTQETRTAGNTHYCYREQSSCGPLLVCVSEQPLRWTAASVVGHCCNCGRNAPALLLLS